MGSLRQKMGRLWSGNKTAADVYDDYDEVAEVYQDDEYERAQAEVDGFDDAQVDTYPVHGSNSVTALPVGRERGELAKSHSRHQLHHEGDRRRIVTVRPQRYEEVTRIADVLREGDPVIVNLSDAPTDLARRLIDFLSGAIYMRRGSLETITHRVYLLTPEEYAVSDVSGGDKQFGEF